MRQISLTQKFSLLLLVTLPLFGFLMGKIITSAMYENMLNRSNEMAANFVIHEIRNKLRVNDFTKVRKGDEYQKLTAQIESLHLGPDVMGVKIWNRDYTIVWSSNEEDVGESSPGHHELVEVYKGELISEISDEHHLEEKYAHAGAATGAAHPIMELYIPVRKDSDGEVQIAFEVYRNIDQLLADIRHHNRIIWLSIATGMCLLYLLLYGLVWGASRRIIRQERDIKISEERFRSLIHSAQDGIVSVNRTGKIFLVNRAAEDIFGHTEAEIKNFTLDQLFINESQGDLVNELEYFISSGECLATGKNLELTGRCNDGCCVSLEVSLSASGDEDNRVLTCMIRDISLREQMLKQIARGKKEWEETFDIINDAITIHDKDFNIIRANRAAEEILGLSAEVIFKQKCYRSYHGTGIRPAGCPSCQTAETGIDSTAEIFEPHLDKYLEIKALPRLDEEKNLIGIVHVVRDITDKKEAEGRHEKLQAELRQMQKMETVGRLAGGIAHDFNNMLSAIIGYSELVLHELPEDSQAYRDVETIKDSGEKAAVLTGQLLAFSRNQVLKMQSVNLNAVIEGMVKMLRRIIGENIKLDLRLTPDISSITADQSQLEQIILNLAVNASDAMPDGGSLIIETGEVQLEKEYVEEHPGSRPGKHILFVVSDTGCGMEENIKEQIFDPFYTTKERGKGTGLGLSIVYGIVKQHESQIYVDSEPGKGTTFKMLFPVSDELIEEGAKTAEAVLPEGQETILLAEDDRNIRRMIKGFLEPFGYTLLLAKDGQEALDISRSHEGAIHLLLTDVIMPNMNGQELSDAIQEERPGIKVIFMSGYTGDAIADYASLNSGVNFIQKPVTPSKLAQAMKDVFILS